jgi:hypothetical protein
MAQVKRLLHFQLTPFLTRLAAGVAALAGLASTTAGSGATADVDVALVLAVDCSDSVDRREFRQQMDGLAVALRDPAVLDAIQSGPSHRIAVTLSEWSDFPQPAVVVDWTIVGDAASADAFAEKIEQSRRSAIGGTSISSAIDGGIARLAALPWRTSRAVIDVSGDGTNNAGTSAGAARDRAVGQGIVVNGLAITNNISDLVTYYQIHVAGGPGSFVMKAGDYDAFAKAMANKLAREIASPTS